MIPILILAAGSSSRMRGGDKLLERVSGEPLIRLQCKRALATGHPVFVALPSTNRPRATVLNDLDVTQLIVPEAREGMSGTMRGAIAQLPEAPAFMILLGDLVALETTDLQAVINARLQDPNALIWRGATSVGKPGHPIIFDARLRNEFAMLEGDGGGESIVNRHKDKTKFVRLRDDRARFDLDTPEDWAAWRNSLLEE
jgi:CTP:molybdopterin cytidylyltransferase MocA